MDHKSSTKLEAQILKKEQELAGFYEKLLKETDEAEKRTIIRDIILQKEMSELLMQSMYTA